MKTLHWYVTRQVLASLGMTVAVFAFVLLLGNVMKEVVTLLVNRQTNLSIVLKAIGLLIPYVLVFALPMGMLTATLLVLGRFSADHELTAVRANGCSVLSLISPLLLLSLGLSLVCGWINLEWAPRAKQQYEQLVYELDPDHSTDLLAEGRFNEFPGYVVYVGEKQADGHIKDLWLFQIENNQKVLDLRASKARLYRRPEDGRLVLKLIEAQVLQKVGDRWLPRYLGAKDFPLPSWREHNAKRKPKLREMTFWQLLAEKKALERRLRDPAPPTESQTRLAEETTPIEVQLHRQLAFSFASLAFTLIGIPLGIKAHRRETSAGVAIALMLVLVYYAFVILGEALETHPALAPQLILWYPNFLFQGIGAFLLWRANQQ